MLQDVYMYSSCQSVLTLSNDDFLYRCIFCLTVHRNKGFIYQYFQVVDQELQGHLNIKEEIDEISKKSTVIGGNCQDFFEFREVGLQL